VNESKSSYDEDSRQRAHRAVKKEHARKFSECSPDAKQSPGNSEDHPVQSQRKASHVLVRSVTEGLRNLYSQMFVNTMNSGDLNQVAAYFRTFMAGPCKCAIQHKIDQSYGLPRFMSINGPEMFCHYLLGCFLSFPDLILKLDNAEVFVSKEWRGSRIVLQTQFQGSKLRDLPEYPWTPDVRSLASLYADMDLNKGPTKKTSPKHLHTPERKCDSKLARSESMSSTHTDSSGSTCDDKPPRGSKGTVPAATRKRRTPIKVAPPTTPIPVPGSPAKFMNRLIDETAVLPQPVQLHTRGTITLYLDEQNCMQYMLCEQREFE
jgi:hypothetical protein